MSLDSLHPEYVVYKEDWEAMGDFYQGERVVKAKGETYLPATKGMRLDGMEDKKPGREEYNAYKLRAVFPDDVEQAVVHYIGIMWKKPPVIELPAALEAIREKATLAGESLELLLRRINEQQLVKGRLGLLLDLPKNPDPLNPLPYIATYIAEAITNWDDGESGEGTTNLNLVVLNESGFVRDNDFEWKEQSKYRVLQLGELQLNEPAGSAIYKQGVFVNGGGGSATYVEADMKPPVIRGKTLNKIPFTFVNTKDLLSSPDKPPLIGLGRLCVTIYRGEADYRQNLFMQGQDTFVVIGEISKTDATEDGKSLRTGSGSMVNLEVGGDAKYVGVESQGLEEQRTALENDRKRAEARSGQMISSRTGQKESGEALSTRVAASTATLNSIALTGAAALEFILKIAAEWMGANPDEVKVTPNLEFADIAMTGDTLVKLMTARAMGAPLSYRSIHNTLIDQGLTKMTYEEELELITEENANMPSSGGTQFGGNPQNQNDDE